MEKCPKCGYENKNDALYCNMCKEIFRKEEKTESKNLLETKIQIPSSESILSRSWLWCSAALFVSFFITRKLYIIWFPLKFIKVFFHEIGHTVLYWLFGHFAIPAVNPIDTGGGAMSVSYTPSFPYFVLIIIAVSIYFLRKYQYVIIIGISFIIAYSLLAFTPAKDWLISAGGILAEYMLVGGCLYLCLFKVKFKVGFERFLYGILGWHAFIERLGFLFKLKTNEAFYQNYVSLSGWQQGMTGDLASISFDLNYRFNLNSFDTVVNIFIVLAFVPLVILTIMALKKL